MFDMTIALQSLQLFALLDAQSTRSEIKKTVSLVINDINIAITKTTKTYDIRKSINSILLLLNNASEAKKPWNSLLTKEIHDNILPLLNEKTANENYKFIEAEKILIDHIVGIFKKKLEFLRAKQNNHPSYAKDSRNNNITTVCFFSDIFYLNIQTFITDIIITKMRIKYIENNIYSPLLHQYILKKLDVTEFMNQNDGFIRNRICQILEFLYSTRLDMIAKQQSAQPSIANYKYTDNEIYCEKLLYNLHQHAENNKYFIAKSIGFKFFQSLINLDETSFCKDFNIITDIITSNKNDIDIFYEISKLTLTYDRFNFDMLLLSHYNFGNEDQRITFKLLHDYCIYTANNRQDILQSHPLVATEISRLIVDLAIIIYETCGDKKDIAKIRLYLEKFTMIINQINKNIFAPEINISINIFSHNKILYILSDCINKGEITKTAINSCLQQIDKTLLTKVSDMK